MTTETPDELAMPDFEDRLWRELHELHGRRRHAGPAPAVPTTVRRRPGRAGLLAAVGVAAAAAVAVTVLVDADGAVPGPGPGPEAADASVVELVVRATTEAEEGTILHQVSTGGPGGGTTERWYDQVTWVDRSRSTTADGEPLTDTGSVEPPAVDAPAREAAPPVTGFDQCDPATRLSMDAEGRLHACTPAETPPPQPMAPFRSVHHCRGTYVEGESPLVAHPGWGFLRMYLETGDIVEDGTQEVDGRRLIKLRNLAGDYVYLVDPETYLPVREIVGDGADPTVTTYEHLPRTEENLALLTPPVPEGFAVEPPGTGMPCEAPAPAAGEAPAG